MDPLRKIPRRFKDIEDLTAEEMMARITDKPYQERVARLREDGNTAKIIFTMKPTDAQMHQQWWERKNNRKSPCDYMRS